ncbi:TIR domain-containing protein [Streptomyces sp. CG1]|uniref:TIR domain-containing protein n=1 Tax=Streptomyces sp. CG1 TaxID=1287523 RepID=UPI0034E1D186
MPAGRLVRRFPGRDLALEDCTAEGSVAAARGAGGGRPRKVFVSYSRRDFYSAEAVTADRWAHEPLDPWFDLQRLRPGMDWGRAWEDALATADALLLLASPAAIASEYVRLEWTRVLHLGIPVYIGVIAGTDLPPEPDSFPVHDLGTRFWRRVHALGEVIVRPGARPGRDEAGHGRSVSQWPPRLRVPVSIAAFVVCDLTVVDRAWPGRCTVPPD